MDLFSLEQEDNSRLSETFPRETVSLVLNVSEEIHKETLKELEKLKSNAVKDSENFQKSILDLKKVIAEFASSEDKKLDEVFEVNDFMISQKKLIPKEMLTFSSEKFESQLQKSLTRLTISFDKSQSKVDSISAIILDLKNAKNNTFKKVAKEIFFKKYF
jgi:hypothetical protein